MPGSPTAGRRALAADPLGPGLPGRPVVVDEIALLGLVEAASEASCSRIVLNAPLTSPERLRQLDDS